MSETALNPSWLARSLALEAPTLAPNALCHDALEIFNASPEIFALAIVRHGVPRGLVSRIPLMTTFARPNMRDLYDRRPVSHLMDRTPLIVDGATSITELSALIYRLTPMAMINGFIVAENGRYAGIGNGVDLLRRTTEQSEERNRELQQAMHHVVEANSAKSQFLANISHELRTPLNAVLGFGELMRDELFGPLGHPKYREYVRDILASASHLHGLINDVLDLSKAEAGKFELDIDVTDLPAIAKESLRLVAMRADEASLTLESYIAEELPPVMADARKLKQIMLNLLSNAIKFTPEGGSVALELYRRQSGVFHISVTDTGIGMSREDVQKALSPFGQVANTQNRKYSGTGLGLPLAKALIELHGGNLRIASTPGAGTAILVNMPLALAAGGAAREIA